MKNIARLFVIMFFLCTVPLNAQKPKNMAPGVERWPIKISVHRLYETPKDVSFDNLIALPGPNGVTKNDPRYQDAFIPSFSNSLNLREGDMVSVSGWLHLVAFETDGDYHIQISNSDTAGDHCLIVEVPYPRYIKKAPNLKKLFTNVRNFIKKNLLNKAEPSQSGTILKDAAYVTVTGQLFYDDSHVGDPPRGKKGMHAATLWEIHPITDIHLTKAPANQ
ncbi:MAG TPA: hypothetical protein VLX91_07310 [Candidatus Acidoferrales bacterium]|nr:hypothetical protein [Candidatus Acidoferrales bacterium]